MIKQRNLFFVATATTVAREMDGSIMFRDGILEGFSPNFKSIRKDHDRYSDELVKLFEAGEIDLGGVS